ncbi:OprO/OprP family phosphate-selective porin [Acetobacter okinawensis]|uniref:OprO/OprP family phosphate-selective porin n=1 Tax=Acetobacter okinawensis TaxID=1076594 RepID=UPI00046F318E|nr:porin [Acetobacter okinawensis]
MAVSVRASILLTTTVSSLFLPSVAMAASSDAENAALRREIAAMHREMMGEIHRLQARVDKYEHASAQQSHRVTRKPHTLIAGNEDDAQPRFREDPVVPARTGPRSPNESRIALPESPVQSWGAFKAASARDESVDVGGIKIGFPKGRPTIASDDKAYAFSIGLLAQEDFGGFMGVGQRGHETAGNFNKFTENARRLRLYLSWRYKDWVVNVTPDFGANNSDGNVSLFEANLNYTGLHNTTLTVGYFQPRMEEDSAERSGAFEFLERPTIVDLVRNIAGGVGRFSVGGEHYEKRWLVAGYFTGQKYGDRTNTTSITDSQTGGVFRATGRPYVSKNIDVHVGVGATAAFKVNQTSSGRNYTGLKDNPEVPLGETQLLTSGALTNISQVWAAGPQFGFRYKKFLLKGEYYHIGVQHDNVAGNATLPSLNFDGWYVAANYTLLGHGRGYNEKIGAFTTPGVEYDFDPAKGHWGALEISGRWSVTDLRTSGATINSAGTLVAADGKTAGNKQTVWQGGLNWYPNQHIKIMLDYTHFSVSSAAGVSTDLLGRSGNAVVGRVQAAF